MRKSALNVYEVHVTARLRDGREVFTHPFPAEARVATSPELAIQLVQSAICERFEMERITGTVSLPIQVVEWLSAAAQLKQDPLRLVA